MKPETLDALLIDREVGELAPETTELLDAFLAQSPSAAGRAGGVALTVATARRTAIPAGGATTPAFESVAAALRREESRARRRRHGLVLLRAAAAVALGVGLGWLWFTPSGASDHSARVAQSSVPADHRAPGGFWSRENFLGAMSGAPGANQRGRVEWNSLFRKPTVEEMP